MVDIICSCFSLQYSDIAKSVDIKSMNDLVGNNDEKYPQNYSTLQELPTSTPVIDNDKCDDRHVKFDLTTGPELSPEFQPRQISTRAESSTISMQSTNVCQ